MVLIDETALKRASRVYEYYYNHAIREFDHVTSSKLAQIPADYVYNCLIKQEESFLEFLDYEFERLDPEIKRNAYEKAFNVKTGFVSETEINSQLKKRRNMVFKNLYHNKFNEMKENIFCDIFKNMKISFVDPKTELLHIFKTLNLN
jgi:hypothetical protein